MDTLTFEWDDINCVKNRPDFRLLRHNKPEFFLRNGHGEEKLYQRENCKSQYVKYNVIES